MRVANKEEPSVCAEPGVAPALVEDKSLPLPWYRDTSLLTLTIANVLAIFIAVANHCNLLSVMWVYWIQSVTIGLFNVIRIRDLKEFSTRGLKLYGRRAEPTEKTKRQVARIFVVYYGAFHLLFLLYLLNKTNIKHDYPPPGVMDVFVIIIASALLVGSHFHAYFINRLRFAKKQDIGSLMFYPFIRILPMHVTILVPAFIGGAMVTFLVVKTAADAAMHAVEGIVLTKGVS